MNLLDLYEGREPYQQAIDKLEQARIEHLEQKMDYYARHGMVKEFKAAKEERDSYHKVQNEMGYGGLTHEDKSGIGQDIVNKTEKMARATPPTKAGAVASTVKNAAKWLAGKGGPGKEGPTYEGAEDIADRGEYDQEGDMAKDNIHTIVRNAKELESILGDNDNLPEWVQDKLANIKGMMTAVSDYMQTQKEREHEEATGEESVTFAEDQKKNSKLPLNQRLNRLKVQARREFPQVNSDEEALLLKLLDKETQDDQINRRVDARQDAEIKRNFDLDREQEDEIEDLQSTANIKEHGGGIGPKQRWQDLMQERKLNVGDPVIVTAPNEFEGKTGEIAEFSPSGKFVVVNLYNHGNHSMHLSDVEFNQYAADQDQDDWYDDEVIEGWSDAVVSRRTGQPRTPYSVYIKGKKWKDFENEDHAENVANKLRAKFKADGRDPSVITIAPTDYDKGLDESKEAVFRSHDIEVEYPEGKGHSHIYHRREPYRLSTIFSDANSVAARNRRAKISLFVDGEYIPNYEWQEGVDAPNGGIAEDIGSWIVYDPETKQIKKRFKTHTAGKSYAKTHKLGFASSEYYFDNIKPAVTAEGMTDYQKRRQRERDVDAGRPVSKQRQPRMTDYQKRRAQDKRDMELGEDQDTSGVESAIIRRIMVAHLDWLQRFGPEKVMQAAEEVAYNVGDVDEIGTSDVSAYVHEVGQILGVDQLDEKWSAKYKRSIDCSHPKGFSQRAHCAGRKK